MSKEKKNSMEGKKTGNDCQRKKAAERDKKKPNVIGLQ